MKNKSIILIFALSAAVASYGDDLPQSAQALIQQMNSDVIAARKRAIDGLERIKATEVRRGNSAGENAAAAKIIELSKANFADTQAAAQAVAQLTPPPAVGAGTPLTASAPAKTEIKANAKFGVSLGAIRPGQHVTLQYVEGRWNLMGQPDPAKWFSPDEAPRADNRLGIYSLENGEAKLLSDVPNGTKHHPFHYHFLKNYENVILRIQDGDASDNPGSAIYVVTLSK